MGELARLKQFRTDAGLSQRQAAEKVDVKRETWARWELGIRQIGDDKLPLVVELTGIAPEELRPDKAPVWRRETAQ